MNARFSSVHNFNEQAIFRSVDTAAPLHPELSAQPGLLADVACVALNRLLPRYIRHDVDAVYYTSDDERAQHDVAVSAAVTFAFGFVRARAARGAA
jgi:hypothetical protein